MSSDLTGQVVMCDSISAVARSSHTSLTPLLITPFRSLLANLSSYSTFLKRKGGLFKKAHELSVLCSVDVAVIIFGHNKKLYEYSSGDINETIGRFQYVRSISLSIPFGR